MSQMSAEQVRNLLQQNIGHRVSLQSRTTTLSGVIVDLQGPRLIVSNSVTRDNGQPDTPLSLGPDKWWTPAQTVNVGQTPDATVLTWVKHIFGEQLPYRLTVYKS